MWPRFYYAISGTPSTRRQACIRRGERIIDVPKFTAEPVAAERTGFQQLFFENLDPREELVGVGWPQEDILA